MKKNRYPFLIAMIEAVMVMGCANLYNDAGDSANPNVYVVGYERTTIQYNNALYWKNGAMHRLTNYAPDSPIAKANSVFVYKGKPYIVGVDTGNPFSCIGPGGVNELTDGDEANSVFVYNNDVYVAGYFSGGNYANAVVWKNGVSMPLTTYTNTDYYARAYSVFVHNGDVYVAGQDPINASGAYNAVYWKNGSKMILNLTGADFEARAYSIFIYNGDVFTAGSDRDTDNRAVYWRNQTQESVLSSKSVAHSIFVADGDIYIAGSQYDDLLSKDRAVFWKNGQIIYLTDGTNSAAAYSIFVYNDDVYVAGYEDSGSKEIAKYWKNGREIILYSGTYNYRASSIFVSGD